MTSVTLKQVKKTYVDKAVIHGADLSIAEGEFIVIVGPSGCGKSTLLRMIAGLEEMTSGDIYIGERLVNNMEPKDRRIAMVFQNYALYPHMKVFANMAYGLRIRKKISKAEIKERVLKVADILHLTEVLDRKPSQLSGGQRQRVAMGRAMVRKPDVFLFDEPLSNLDAKLRVQMRLEIRKLHNDLKNTIIYVTHDQMEAMTLADRIVVMNHGQIEQIGTPLDLYHKPSTLFVAGFIGSPAMNFVDARISDDGEQVYLDKNISFPITIDVPPIYYGKNITLGIRPENIVLPKEHHTLRFELMITMIEAIGSDTLVYGHLPNSTHMLTARLPGKWQADGSNAVTVTVKPNSLHMFDKDTQERIYSNK